MRQKQHVLDAASYIYNFDREVYFNRSAKKIFSVDFIEEHNATKLEQSILEPRQGRGWKFYFISEPPESVKRQIVEALG